MPESTPTPSGYKRSSADLSLLFGAAVVVAVVLLQVFLAAHARPADGAKQQQQQQQQQQRGDLHLRRRVQHAATGLAFVGLSYVIPPKPGSALLLIAALALFVLHRVRLRSDAAQELYLKLFGSLLRPHEKYRLPGAFCFLLGTAIATISFPLRVARLSVLALSLGDPAAALVGTTVGGPRLFFDEHASLGGCLACLAVTFGLGRGCMGFPREESLMAAAAATLAEALAPTVGVDDNLLIPVVTGAVLCLYSP